MKSILSMKSIRLVFLYGIVSLIFLAVSQASQKDLSNNCFAMDDNTKAQPYNSDCWKEYSYSNLVTTSLPAQKTSNKSPFPNPPPQQTLPDGAILTVPLTREQAQDLSEDLGLAGSVFEGQPDKMELALAIGNDNIFLGLAGLALGPQVDGNDEGIDTHQFKGSLFIPLKDADGVRLGISHGQSLSTYVQKRRALWDRDKQRFQKSYKTKFTEVSLSYIQVEKFFDRITKIDLNQQESSEPFQLIFPLRSLFNQVEKISGGIGVIRLNSEEVGGLLSAVGQQQAWHEFLVNSNISPDRVALYEYIPDTEKGDHQGLTGYFSVRLGQNLFSHPSQKGRIKMQEDFRIEADTLNLTSSTLALTLLAYYRAQSFHFKMGPGIRQTIRSDGTQASEASLEFGAGTERFQILVNFVRMFFGEPPRRLNANPDIRQADTSFNLELRYYH